MPQKYDVMARAVLISPDFYQLRNDGDGCPVGEQYLARVYVDGSEVDCYGETAEEALVKAYKKLFPSTTRRTGERCK